MFVKRHVVLLPVLLAPTARAATVEFAPNIVTLDPSVLPASSHFEITLHSDSPTIQSADVIFGTGADGLSIDGFAPFAICDPIACNPFEPAPIGIYPNDLYVRVDFRYGPGVGPLYNFGTLQIGVPRGLGPGDYAIFVDTSQDLFSNLNGVESLSGVGTVRIVPEPATLLLAMIGGLGLIRTRGTCG